MTIKAVLFDIDGTLVDSNEHHVTAWQQVFEEAGSHFGRQTIHDQIGKGTDMLVPTLLPDVDEEGQRRLGDAHGKMFTSRFLDGIEPFADATALLRRVHAAGMRVVLASSASSRELDHYIDLLDARDLVAETTCSDDVENTKPAPDIFAVALDKLDPLVPDDAIVVGDTPYDIESAGKCGIAAIGLRSGGFADATLERAGAIAIYNDVAALLHDFDESPLAA